MSYTKRTCSKCGYRDIQPNMKQITETYTSGHSQKAISGRSVVGAFLGDPRAKKQNGDWLLGNTKRKYTRNRKVWVCRSGCGSKSVSNSAPDPTPTYTAPKGKSRKSLTNFDDLRTKDCRAEHFYETVGEVDYDERTAAERALVWAYLEHLEETAYPDPWYVDVANFLWGSFKFIFTWSSVVLWILLAASIMGML